jgi:hypothetical protein
MIGQSREDVGEPSLRVNVVEPLLDNAQDLP